MTPGLPPFPFRHSPLLRHARKKTRRYFVSAAPRRNRATPSSKFASDSIDERSEPFRHVCRI